MARATAAAGPSRPARAVSAQARPSRQSGPSLATATKARKRPVLDEEDEDDGAAANGEIDLDALEGLSDDEAEEEDEEDEEEDEDDEDEDGEDFPELDIGSDEDGEEFPQLDIGSDEEEAAEDEEADGKSADEAATAEDGADADTESEEDEELDDEDSMSESGYNSSDIEAMYDSPASPGSSSTTLIGEERLSKLIAKHTVKPDDDIGAEGQISGAKLGEGRLRPSKLVKGGFTREYEDVEAGYGSESSTEDNPNTIGNVPIEWYEDLPHIGYDVSGRKIFRPAKGDELDKFLSNVEDPSAWTSVEDKLLQQQVQLTDQELDIIRRLEKAENPDAGFDPYQETIEWFTSEERTMPLSAQPEPKRRFVPSKWEHKKVMKIVKAIREGRIVPNKPSVEKPRFYPIWSEGDKHVEHAMYMPAPQLPPPKTAESYNPPEEYLPTEEEKREWEETDKEDRKTDFLPQKYDALRLVPGYKNLVQEKFERCLDLYLAPRTRRVKLNIDPESLVPKLPSPKELRPFPIAQTVQYRHPGSTRVRCTSVSSSGEWVASGSEDGVVRLWDLGNGREVWRWDLKNGAIQHVEWSPNREEALLVALTENRVSVISPLWLVPPQVAAATLEHVNTGYASSASSTKMTAGKEIKGTEKIRWTRPTETDRERGVLVTVEVPGTPKQVAWHRKGDYFATVATEAENLSVLIHQLSKHASQPPFKRTAGSVQRVAFHPNKPHFFAATKHYIKLYDLTGQQPVKTLQTGVRWISSMDIHPDGENVIMGSYDKKLCWFDLELGTKPYKTLRYHQRALRSVAFHPRLPLFASSSDDGTIHIFHASVPTEMMGNPLIVPLKILRGHRITDGLGVLEVKWHPEKPWLVSSGADGEVRLWCS